MTTNQDRDQAITAAEANRGFSRLMREVREGHGFVVTSHGRPIARIAPFEAEAASRRIARDALFARLENQTAEIDIGSWRRDELYDR